MKTIFFIATLIMGLNTFAATSKAEKTYTFKFRTIKEVIAKKASSQDEAFKLAAKDCFNQLTGGKYPGEEKGLDIIDICANPKM